MGFTPLASSAPAKQGFNPGFTPLPANQDEVQPGAFAPAVETIKDIGRVYPVVESAGNLATQALAIPVAGVAGLGAIASNTLGMTETDPAEVVHKVAGALTYQPQTESGKHLTNAAMYPFAKLQEAGQYVGGKTLDATGSPALATAADTAVNVLPMALPVKVAKPKGMLERAADKYVAPQVAPEVQLVSPKVMATEAPHVPVQNIAQAGGRPSEVVQEAIRQPDANLTIAEAERTPQAADLLPIESMIADQQGGHLLSDAKVSTKVSTENPRAGFTPIDEAAMRNTPAETPASANLMNLPAVEKVAKVEVAKDIAIESPNNTHVQHGETFNQPVEPVSNIIQIGDIPRKLTISNPETGKGQFNARKVFQNANKRVEKLESLSSAGIDRKGMPILDEVDLKEIRARTNKNMGKMPEHEARAAAVQSLLDEALADQQMVVELIREEMGIPPAPKAVVIGQGPGEPIGTPAKPVNQVGEYKQVEQVAVPQTSAQVVPPKAADVIVKAQEQEAGKNTSPVDAGAHEAATSPLNGTPEPTQNQKVAGNYTPIKNTLPDAPVDSRAAWAPGANYTGFADKATTAGKLAEKPIRREDVLVPLMKGLGARLYEGRVKGKRLGFYLPKLEAVRIKNKSDLEVAAHEIAHMLDDRIPAIRESWLKGDMAKVHAEELRGVSYDKTKLFEGFAEFTRLYMAQPEKAKAAAPNFYRWFDDFTKSHKYGPTIRNAQEGMTAWFNQDALARAQSKIGKNRIINEALDGMGDKFRQAVTDDLHGIYRMERQLTGRTSPIGAYETARLTRGAGGLVDGAIRLGVPIRKANGSFDFQGKGLEKILEPVAGNLDEFLMYAVGRSSHELMMQGREKLFTPAEVRSMLQLKKPEFDTAFAEYQQWNKGVLDFAESMGIINKKARGMWQRSQYLPFYRAGQPGASASRGGAQGNWAGIQALTGGTGNLRDILGNMTQNAATLIDTALKNEARAKIVKLAETQGGGNFLVKIAPDSKMVKIDREQIKDKLLESMGIDPLQVKRGNIDADTVKMVELVEQQMDNAPGLFEFMVHGQTPKGNIMAVLEDGKPTYYEVADPLLYRAVSSLNRAPQHWIVRWLGLPKRIGQTTITLTPDFMVANLARDTIMGSVMSRAGFRPFIDSAKGMASRIRQDPTYREYLANGGGFASYLKDENTFRAHLDRFYTSKGINPKTVLDTPDKMLYFMETLADSFEMSTRLGEYKRLKEQGEHPRHAAYLAREISTDFAMKGDSQVLGALYDTVMFLRPAVVSMDRLYRGLAHDPNKGAIAAKAGTIALLSAWLYWHNKDNPRYDELEDWDKDSYWHFFVPVDGKEEHFRYPKIWEVGAIASLSERTVAKLNEQEPEYGKAVGRILKNLFNLNMMPQVVAPLYEQATNRNSFTNAPIETTGMENLQPFMRAKPTTSEALKAAGMATRELPESAQVNPVRTEALLRGYFNTWAMYGLMLTDSALFSDKLPEKRMDELPVVRRFYEADPVKHTKYETMYYDMLGEARRLHGTMRELDQIGRREIADDIEKSPLSSKAKQLERASRNIQTINADMEEVRRSVLTPAEKRVKLDTLTREKNELLKATVLDVKSGASGNAD